MHAWQKGYKCNGEDRKVVFCSCYLTEMSDNTLLASDTSSSRKNMKMTIPIRIFSSVCCHAGSGSDSCFDDVVYDHLSPQIGTFSFDNIIVGTVIYGINGYFDVILSGHHDHILSRIGPQDLAKYFQAIGSICANTIQVVIQYHYVRIFLDSLQTSLSAGENIDLQIIIRFFFPGGS